jgi:DNA-binding beta-propeller fold protein YncE
MAGAVTTFAGSGDAKTVDGPRLSAAFDLPQAVAVDTAGVVYVTDVGSHRIRMIDTAGTVTTLAGDGVAGFADGSGETAEFFGQEGIAVDPAGHLLFVADGNGGDVSKPYNRIRTISF